MPKTSEAGKHAESESHAFVLRVRLDPLPGGTSDAALRIRLEDIARGDVRHFSDVASVLDHLRTCLEAIVGRTSLGGPVDPA